MSEKEPPKAEDQRALIAVDLGAESCRVSLLRWENDQPLITLVHRFGNGPVETEGGLRWPLEKIVAGVEDGLRQCAAIATEGVRSIAVDGWAVDYVRLNDAGEPLAAPFCYRDERTVAAELALHERISPQRLREITGIQLLRINTLYQMVADGMAALPSGKQWLNLPEYLLHRWGGEAVAEYTNATHTEMIDLVTGGWSSEIKKAAGLDDATFPRIVRPGTLLGKMTGELTALKAFRDTELIAPACHDTASAIAGIPATGDDWAYISSGTWSLVGTPMQSPCNTAEVRAEGYTNLGGVGGTICFHKNVNGMWLLAQCMEAWAVAGKRWDIGELVHLAEKAPKPAALLDVDEPDLLLVGNMTERINMQLRGRGLAAMDESPSNAPAIVGLILHSLAARYATVLAQVAVQSGKDLRRIFVVGGGSRNGFLSRLTAEATGLEVIAGSPESSTVGNFAVQLAALGPDASGEDFGAQVSRWAALLLQA